MAGCIAMVSARSSATDQLKITGLKDTYPANAPIPFTVTKQVPDLVTFAVAAELWLDGQFQETRWDIFPNVLKVAFRHPIELRDSPLNLNWDVPKLMPAIRPRAGWRYRLRIDVLTPQKEHIFSETFSVKGI
jgi:hypothetical protein